MPDHIQQLRDAGLVPVQPITHGSDWNTLNTCEFLYFLTRRLGLRSIFRISEALQRGSWFHYWLQFHNCGSGQADLVLQTLRERQGELRSNCTDCGIGPVERDMVLATEERYCLESGAMYNSMKRIKVSDGMTVFDKLGMVFDVIVGTEIQVEVDNRIITIDLLGYSQKNNALWIVDYKTCSCLPMVRLQICPLEFQTQHYIITLDAAVSKGRLEHLGIGRNVEVGGMIHVAMTKPTIKFGTLDRPFTEKEHTLLSGPRKGQVETRRTYFGEPDVKLYANRVNDWYDGFHEREKEPPVNLSWTAAAQPDSWYTLYSQRVNKLAHFATRNPEPADFIQSSKHLITHDGLHPFLPYYMTDIPSWPSVMREFNHRVHHRDTKEHT